MRRVLNYYRRPQLIQTTVANELQLLISSTFVTDQQQKTSVPHAQAGVKQQEEAKNNGSKNPGATHIRDLFLSFDKGK